MPKKILINGAFGRMGQLASTTIEKQPAFELVGRTGRKDNLAKAIEKNTPDIVIDFTNAHCVWENIQILLQYPIYPLIGTSGLTREQIAEIVRRSKTTQQGGLIVPNFSLGAALQIRCSKLLASYFSRGEIIETHHEKKIDAPSGTALATAAQITEVWAQKYPETKAEASTCNPPIHSIRLPGFVAEQEVLFSAEPETISIVHRVLNREAYMPGLVLACEKITSLDCIHYGLDICLDK